MQLQTRRSNVGIPCLTAYAPRLSLHRTCKGTFVRRSVAAAVNQDASTYRLLNAYWEARGVFDEKERHSLVEAAAGMPITGNTALAASAPLPGIPNTWNLRKSMPQVLEVSRRLVQLQCLLSSSADVVWMVVREPGLLTADFDIITQRLVEMKVASSGTGTDVVAVVVQQPSLLLSEHWRVEPGLGGGMKCDGGTAALTVSGANSRHATQQQQQQQQMLLAWRHGLSTDDVSEWDTQYQYLSEYASRHGDTSVGFRDGDDAGMVRWARKQRADFLNGTLDTDRQLRLQALDFAFHEEDADWQRWFNELHSFKQVAGHCNPMPLSTGVDFYLINWCSIQRIARRSQVLSEQRVLLLDSIDFDWSGADPLS